MPFAHLLLADNYGFKGETSMSAAPKSGSVSIVLGLAQVRDVIVKIGVGVFEFFTPRPWAEE
jgi:hypothetical protein